MHSKLHVSEGLRMKLCSYEPVGGKSDLAHLLWFLDKATFSRDGGDEGGRTMKVGGRGEKGGGRCGAMKVGGGVGGPA